MGVVSKRGRLTSCVIAAFAITAIGGWWADVQAQSRQAVDCTSFRQAERAPRNLTANNAALGRPAGLNTALDIVSRYNPVNGDVNQLRAALADCQAARRGNRNAYNVESYLCIAQASFKLAQSPGQQAETGLRDAYCNFDFAAALADRHTAASARPLRATAHEGRGNTLIALHNMSLGSAAAAYRDDAVLAYSAAISAEPNAERYRSRAVGLLEQGHIAQARSDIAAAWNGRGDGSLTTGPDLALTLVRIGRAPNVADSAQLFGWAAEAAPNSVSANAALGIAYFNAGDFERARTALENANRPTAVDDSQQGSTNYLAEARYHLALIEIENARRLGRPANWNAVFSYADGATGRAGSSAFEHRRLRCVAYIRRGWSANDQPQADYCASLGGSPEAELLRGMYYLRLAQYLNPRSVATTPARQRYIEAITQATTAFNRGNDAALRSPNPDATASWRPEYQSEFNVRHVLEYGRSVITADCPLPSDMRIPRGIDRAIEQAGYAFYENFDLFKCDARYL